MQTATKPDFALNTNKAASLTDKLAATLTNRLAPTIAAAYDPPFDDDERDAQIIAIRDELDTLICAAIGRAVDAAHGVE